MNELTHNLRLKKELEELKAKTFLKCGHTHNPDFKSVIESANENPNVREYIEDLERLVDTAQKELESAKVQNEVMREALKLSHRKMQEWFSSEYMEHPDTIKVQKALESKTTSSILTERERMREALEEIAKYQTCEETLDGKCCTYPHAHIARIALSEP